MENIQKWGFGMAPFKTKTAQRNRDALIAVKNFVNGEGTVNLNTLIDDISSVKGIFNRVIRQDQWDWFTVNMYLDYPSHRDLVNIVSSLTFLRKAIIDKDDHLGKKALSTLAEKLIKPKSPNTHISGWKEFYYKVFYQFFDNLKYIFD